MTIIPSPFCEKITVIQSDLAGFLGGPYQVVFNTDDHLRISITQCGVRTIEISSTDLASCDKLFFEFQTIEKLLMLLDGKFYTIEDLSFHSEHSVNNEELDKYSKHLLNNRLDYYLSKEQFRYHFAKMLDFSTVLSSAVYMQWKKLLEQMDISYQMLLYALSDNKLPIDVNFAFLVELAEPFVELIQENTFLCKTLSPGERGTTLKMCIDTIITHFGTVIFSKELNGLYLNFLDNTVGSRVRIMHIKAKQKKYWEAKECARYSMKFSILYRRIILELLGIPYDSYETQLRAAIEAIDSW